tara:strand:- start:940 stop:1248 length:309 start_codon:yes stop_codon:yes gene_type:complete
MTSASAPTVKDQKLVSFGLIESASVNSITDFTHLKSNEFNREDKDDFVNTFICHLIFYTFFCVAIVLHILIDLGLGSFIKNNFVNVFGMGKKTVFEKTPAFA